MDKRTEIIKLASADLKGTKQIKYKSKVLKGILIAKEAESKVINADFIT